MKRKITAILLFYLCAWCILSNFSLAAAQPNQDYIYNDFNKRDPLLPLIDAQGMPRSNEDLFKQAEYNLPIAVKISGIMFSESAPFAVINGKVFKVGDSITEGLVVNKINPDNIILTYGSKLIKITMGGVKKDENK